MVHRVVLRAVLTPLVLTPLVVAMFISSLVTAVAVQHRQNEAAALAAADRAARPAPGEPPPASAPPAPAVIPPSIPPPPAPQTPPKPVPKPPVQAKGVPCVSTVRACVKLSTRQAWLMDGSGKLILGPVPITSGKKGAATSTGMWSVLWKDRNHKSREFDDAPMPYSVFFEPGGIAFHTGSLRAQSSGCIHLSNAAASRFFGELSVGDPVQVLK